APDRGLYPVERTGVAGQVAFQRTVGLADAEAPPGTAFLAVGSGLSWHQQIWAPLWTARPLFYDNWLWYWHLDHAGPPGYVALRGHHYPEPALALDRDYLRHHGIGGAVTTVRTNPGAPPAGLRSLGTTEGYRAMVVSRPTTLVTSGGVNATETVYGNGRIGATLAEDGEIVVRHNWFPRWKATLDGAPAAIARAPDGTMRLAGGRRGQRLDLVYAADGWDWTARMMSAAGVVGIGAWVGFGRRKLAGGVAPASRTSRRGGARYPPPDG
ncbi:MAG TPA: hypothetical protein VER37_04350, partial [Thermomicrobiales bacterium]|nr:hypothetical protein [Thermomicrobiales bacterium]